MNAQVFGLPIDVAQFWVSVIGLVSLVGIFIQLRLSKEMMEKDNQWKKILSYHDYFSEVPLAHKTDEMFEALGKFDRANNSKVVETVKLRKQIPPDLSIKLVADHDTATFIFAYLDDFEEFCGAIRAGVVQKEYAYSLERTRIMRAYKVFENFITQLQKPDGDGHVSCAYEELKQVATELQHVTDPILEEYREKLSVKKIV